MSASQIAMDVPKKNPEEKKTKKDSTKKTTRRPRKPVLKTKVVVRRLPPQLPKDEFMETVKAWVNEETVDYSSFISGKIAKSFHRGFDGHTFVDNRGNENRAVVEFAPYQKMPKKRKTEDARQATIDDDPSYLEFLKFLEAEKNRSAETLNDSNNGVNPIEKLENRIAMNTARALAAEQASKPKTTPLLEHLRAQKAAQAAIKAKKAAKKNTRRKNEKESSGEQSASSSTEKKPKKERNRKKKEGEANANTSNGPATAKKEKPREPKKEGSKPKRNRKPEGKKQTSSTIKVLNRPSGGGNPSASTSG
ncbi:Smg-4/UPF3 family-domain-containing protein [Sporodiniella umbellata]|nr:Smg-4/UPF3 family-domain-containing protein [Sporodiniella umbellata]